jgi:hypothetical protein
MSENVTAPLVSIEFANLRDELRLYILSPGLITVLTETRPATNRDIMSRVTHTAVEGEIFIATLSEPLELSR